MSDYEKQIVAVIRLQRELCMSQEGDCSLCVEFDKTKGTCKLDKKVNELLDRECEKDAIED